VNFQTAEAYLGISDRQHQNLIKDGTLEVRGEGTNRKITTESLRKYLPLENPNQSETIRSNPKLKLFRINQLTDNVVLYPGIP
jgi:hypothetical protein